MEKYGVDTEADLDKTAQENTTCPDCGAVLPSQTETGVLLCPNCGSEPFEGGSNV